MSLSVSVYLSGVNWFSLEHSKHLKLDIKRVLQECFKGVIRLSQESSWKVYKKGWGNVAEVLVAAEKIYRKCGKILWKHLRTSKKNLGRC